VRKSTTAKDVRFGCDRLLGITLAIVVSLCVVRSSSAADKPAEPRRILIITEVETTAPAVSTVVDTLRERVRQRLPYEVQFYNESLDTALLPDKTSQSELRDSFVRKYSGRKPDVIVAVGPAPLKFTVESGKDFFPGTPIVFSGSSKEQADSPVLDSRFTGAWMTLDPLKTVEAALRLQPHTRHVVVVGGASSYDKHIEDLVSASLAPLKSKVDITYLYGLDMPTLLDQIRHLPRDTIILYTSIQRDGFGTRFVNAIESIPLVAGAANVPVFAMADSHIGRGFVGGYARSFAEQGQIGAEDIIQILQGKKPEDIPIVQGASAFTFDDRALKRWGINERDLPPGSIVLFRQPSLLDNYRWPIIASSLVAFLLALLCAYLLSERRRRRAETDLEREVKFEKLISELSAHFINLPADKVDEGIHSALNRVVESLAIDRACILEFTEDSRRLEFTHSCDVQATLALGRSFETKDLPYLMTKLLQNETLVISNVDECLEMALRERQLFRWRGERSGVFVPLKARGCQLGVLAFVSQEERQWSEKIVGQCRMLGQIFANALVRNRADEALTSSELLQSAILASLSSAIAVIDRKGEILGTNAQVERGGQASGMAFEKEFCVGANLLEFYRNATSAGDRVAAAILAGIRAVLHGESGQFELEWPKQSRQGRRWFLTSVTPLKTAEGGAVITRSEITARKQEEDERLELSGRLINMQEKERSRLARELHDDFNQRLAVLAIDLERASLTVVDSPAEASQKLHELWNRASEIGADLHSLSHRLHSSTLESLGLILGVSSLCDEFAGRHDIQVDFTHENIPHSVPPDIALCLFRIAQEGLRNVRRHSGASRAEVRLQGTEQAISLRIEDKGIGFDSSRSKAGLGIRSMQERIRLLGGRFEIRSQSGEGTVISVWVPLAGKESTEEDPTNHKQMTAAR
jgi:signal transduction histidine kinase/ABC-type uncharacterized transport system substrate-binding protein